MTTAAVVKSFETILCYVVESLPKRRMNKILQTWEIAQTPQLYSKGIQSQIRSLSSSVLLLLCELCE